MIDPIQVSAVTDFPQSTLRERVATAAKPGKVFIWNMYGGPNGEHPAVWMDELCKRYGLIEPHMVGNVHFFDDPEHPNPTWIDEKLFRDHLQTIDPKTPLVFVDLEGQTYSQTGEGWVPFWHNETAGKIELRPDIMDKRLRILDIFDQERPDLKDRRGYWSYTTCDMPSWIWGITQEWARINEGLKPLRDRQGMTMPYWYPQSPRAKFKPGGQPVPYAPLHVQLSLMVRLIAETRRTDGIEKPIYVWLMPQWYDLWQLPGVDCEISARMWQAWLHTAYYLGGNDDHFGCCLWLGQHRNGVKQTWDENADWWQVTKDLLLVEGVT